MPKRWYDTEATLSLAISMLKNASEDIQASVCSLMDMKFEELKITRTEKFIVFKVFDKRWYDENENVYNLLETIRNCDSETQRKLAISIIDHICNISQ